MAVDGTEAKPEILHATACFVRVIVEGMVRSMCSTSTSSLCLRLNSRKVDFLFVSIDVDNIVKVGDVETLCQNFGANRDRRG